MATRSSVLAWRIPWRSLTGYGPWGCVTEQLRHKGSQRLSRKRAMVSRLEEHTWGVVQVFNTLADMTLHPLSINLLHA